jgi:hypothetical protein
LLYGVVVILPTILTKAGGRRKENASGRKGVCKREKEGENV